MENATNRLNKIALWLLAIVPGIYFLNFIGRLLFYLSSMVYYVVLVLSALVYIGFMVLVHKAYLQVRKHFIVAQE